MPRLVRLIQRVAATLLAVFAVLAVSSASGCSDSSSTARSYPGRVTNISVERVGIGDHEVGTVYVKTDVELDEGLGTATFTKQVTVVEQGDDPFSAGRSHRQDGESEEAAALRIFDLRVGDYVEVTDYGDGGIDYKKIGN